MKKSVLIIICVIITIVSGCITGIITAVNNSVQEPSIIQEATKPVLYLYPEYETNISVKVSCNGHLTTTYPKYNNGWNVTATPNGKILYNNNEYNYLYWEGDLNTEYDFSKGFCVKGEDTAEFLEWILQEQGLNRKEANEFIVYWLPRMEHNSYNLISFQTTAYTENAKLEVSPSPDTMIRVFMAWFPINEYVDIQPQEFSALGRTGFTVVEWGGCEVNGKTE